MKRVLAVSALLTASIVVSLLFAELLVRVVAPQQLVVARPDLWVPDSSGLGHRHAGDADAAVNTGEREVRFRTDRDGYRLTGAEPSARDAKRVLVLGDSFLEALSVADEDHVVTRLSAELAARLRSPVAFVNTAVSEYSPVHYRIIAGRETVSRSYDAVLMFVYVINDVMLRPRESYPPRAFELERELRWPAAFNSRELMNGVVHPIYTRLRGSSHLVVFVKRRTTNLLVRLGLTSSGQFPIVLRRDFRYDRAWDITTDEIARTSRLTLERDLPFAVVLIPADYQVDRELAVRYAEAHGLRSSDIDPDLPNLRLREKLEARGIEVIDLLPALRRAHAGGVAVYGGVDRHTGPEGHRVMAEEVAPWLEQQLGADVPARPVEP